MNLLKDTERYCLDEMTREEKCSFERTLFVKEFTRQVKKLKKVIWINQHRVFIGCYCVLTIILITFAVSYIMNDETTSEKLFTSFYKPYKVDAPEYRSNDNSIYSNACLLYDKGNYQNAVIAFRDIVKKDSTDILSKFMLGLSLMETNNYDEAIINLSCITDKGAISASAKWYLSLCYLKTNQTFKAEKILIEIANKNSYQPLAKKILKDINRVRAIREINSIE